MSSNDGGAVAGGIADILWPKILPCADKSSKAKSSNLMETWNKECKILLGGIFLRKCEIAKSLMVQAIGGQGWIEIQNWILSIVLDTEWSSATHLSENPQVRLDTREIPTGDTERRTDNCDTTSDTNRPTQSNNAVFTSQRHNNSAPSLSRTMTSFQVKDKIDHNTSFTIVAARTRTCSQHITRLRFREENIISIEVPSTILQ